MKRSRIEKPRFGGSGWQEVLPLDPRDPDVARAKAIRSALRVPSVKAARKPE